MMNRRYDIPDKTTHDAQKCLTPFPDSHGNPGKSETPEAQTIVSTATNEALAGVISRVLPKM